LILGGATAQGVDNPRRKKIGAMPSLDPRDPGTASFDVLWLSGSIYLYITILFTFMFLMRSKKFISSEL
jgi:hypothetical protein